MFSGDAQQNGVDELFRVPVDGDVNEVVRLSPDRVSGGDVFDFVLSPDGKTVVYRSDLITNDVIELFSVPVTGGDSVRLNPSLESAALSNRDVGSKILIDPSSRFVLYRLDLAEADELELFRVPIVGGNSTLLGASGVRSTIELTPDGATVVFASDQRRDGVAELYAAPLDATSNEAYTLHPALNNNQDISGAAISPDGRRVIF